MSDPVFQLSEIRTGRSIDLDVEGGLNGVSEDSQTPSTILLRGGPGKHGDFDPSFGFIPIDTWRSGLGGEFHSDDPERYFDGNAFTALPGKLVPPPFWQFAKNHRDSDFHLSANKSWKPLYGSTRYSEVKVTSQAQDGANYAADKLYLWIRRIGEPGTLTVELTDDNAGDPSTVNQTVTKTTSDITDTLTVLQVFDWTGTETLTDNTAYHIKVYGASTDSVKNHWEIAVDTAGTASQVSSDGSSWSSASYTMNYRIVDADTDRVWYDFEMEGCYYTVDKKADATASQLYIVGDRGIATSATATTLVDTNTGARSAWVADQFNNAWIKITKGTGKGQIRQITDTGTTSVTVATWSVTPDATSEYVIYGTEDMVELTTTGLGDITGPPAVADNIVFFPQGSADNIRRAQWTSGTPGHSYADDSTNRADRLLTAYDPVDGPIIWRAENDSVDVSRATVQAWGTDLTFGTEIQIGDSSYDILNMAIYKGQLHVGKADSVWVVSGDRAERLPVQLNSMPETTNMQAMLASGNFLYFNWTYSLQRLFGSTLDDVDINRDAGLPSTKTGPISDINEHPVGIFVAIDGLSSNKSGIYLWDQRGYHPVYIAWEAGQRLQQMNWQSNINTRSWLWASVGGDRVYMKFPIHHRSPLRDSSFEYFHEMFLTTGIIDYGNTSINKDFTDLEVVAKNLNGTGIEGFIDKQEDTAVTGTTFTDIGFVSKSPSQSVAVNASKVKQLRLRSRFLTNTATTPPEVDNFTLKGAGHTPQKRQWSMNIRVRSKRASSAKEIYNFLIDNSGSEGGLLWLSSRHPEWTDKRVFVDFPASRTSNLKRGGEFKGTATIVLREA